MMHLLLICLTLFTTNQIFKEHRRDHQVASATGRRIIALALGESINPTLIFFDHVLGYYLAAECDSTSIDCDLHFFRNLCRDNKLHWMH